MYKTEQFNRGYERPMQHTGIHSSLILKANYFCGSIYNAIQPALGTANSFLKTDYHRLAM